MMGAILKIEGNKKALIFRAFLVARSGVEPETSGL